MMQKPGQQALLYDLSRIKDKNKPQVLASTSRIYEEKRSGNNYSFVCESPSKTVNSMRILLPAAPKNLVIADNNGGQVSVIRKSWYNVFQTYYVSFNNDPGGIYVRLIS